MNEAYSMYSTSIARGWGIPSQCRLWLVPWFVYTAKYVPKLVLTFWRVVSVDRADLWILFPVKDPLVQLQSRAAGCWSILSFHNAACNAFSISSWSWGLAFCQSASSCSFKCLFTNAARLLFFFRTKDFSSVFEINRSMNWRAWVWYRLPWWWFTVNQVRRDGQSWWQMNSVIASTYFASAVWKEGVTDWQLD